MFLFATCWWNSPNQNQPNPKQSQNQTKKQTLQTKPHKHDPTNQTLETTQHNPKPIKTNQNFWKQQTQPKQHDQNQNQNNAKQPKTCLKTTQNHPTPGAKPHQNLKTCQDWKKNCKRLRTVFLRKHCICNTVIKDWQTHFQNKRIRFEKRSQAAILTLSSRHTHCPKSKLPFKNHQKTTPKVASIEFFPIFFFSSEMFLSYNLFQNKSFPNVSLFARGAASESLRCGNHFVIRVCQMFNIAQKRTCYTSLNAWVPKGRWTHGVRVGHSKLQ